MKRTRYISTSKEFPTLAEETWEVLRPFLCRYQWAFDDPSYSPRKTEIASAILNRGKKGACTFQRPEGYKYILPVLHHRHFEQAVNQRRIYYVSYGKQALLYLDIDLHNDWQTLEDGQRAQTLLDNLLQRFFRGRAVVFWSPSSRGFNGYLKVDLQGESYESANALFLRLENALRLVLARYMNLADFELKGTIGYVKDGKFSWGKYGKLPIHCPDWNFAKLEEFKTKPVVKLRRLAFLAQKIEAAVPQELLERNKALKEAKGDAPFIQGDQFLVTPTIEKMLLKKYGECWRYVVDCDEDREGNQWMDLKYYRPGQLPMTGREWRATRNEKTITKSERENQYETHQSQSISPLQRAGRTLRPGTDEQNDGGQRTAASGTWHDQSAGRDNGVHRVVGRLSGAISIHVADLVSEPDSFARQLTALLHLARYLKRVPTIEEALAFIKEQRLFSGTWEDNQAKRNARVRSILNFIARDFDAAKCAKGSVNDGKYDKWAASKFPNGLTGRSRSKMSEYGDVVQGHGVHISPSFIAAFMAVCEFALQIDKNVDQSLPHNRAKEIWESLYDKGLISVPFCNRKWAICREAMVRFGIVRITDRNYGPHKAMRWDLGQFFPFLGLWKGTRVISRMGGGELRITRREHNTLLHKQTLGTTLDALWMPARPPP